MVRFLIRVRERTGYYLGIKKRKEMLTTRAPENLRALLHFGSKRGKEEEKSNTEENKKRLGGMETLQEHREGGFEKHWRILKKKKGLENTCSGSTGTRRRVPRKRSPRQANLALRIPEKGGSQREKTKECSYREKN